MQHFSHHYQSDISRQQFDLIRQDLEASRKRTHPKHIDPYDIFCAMLYVLKNGCTWRDLPADYPKWSTVYYYWMSWSKAPTPDTSFINSGFKKIVADRRLRQGRSARTSFVILDAQSIKNTATAENKGYDGGKKISGIKRHLAVDINGFPQAIHITRANITDCDGAIALVTLNLEQFKLVRTMMVDSGYTGQNFANEISSLTSAKVIVVKKNELHQFLVIPQRWLIERSFSWLGNYHRLWRNCERKLNTSLMMVSLAFIRLFLKRY
ncbi:IS5 family transposase [Lentilactobacillus kefiri]|nr:IS5 family transposase [Lentilactobacillus kefiri]MCJ2162723.1 IS5 family transposase [Lentilactobacillus kefiri]MCP9370058.1 IS5 family transposase [Lentilactobacillus kefiri]MDM7493983.1 IS5 family transposase [Lentilactobacillus kefiri]QGV25993.1 IS5 family transposase [Lentilactobacillus kefiri]QGV26034.1 IS5 family transposase [Lentilactobacillus kefiri]